MFTSFSITLNDIDDVHLLFHYIKYDIDDVHLLFHYIKYDIDDVG
jgi:hypothetical protein